MKLKSMNEIDSSKSLFQSNIMAPQTYVVNRQSTSRQPYNLETKIRKVSPAQHERFSNLNNSQISQGVNMVMNSPNYVQRYNEYGMSQINRSQNVPFKDPKEFDLERRMFELSLRLDRVETKLDTQEATIIKLGTEQKAKTEIQSLKALFANEIKGKENLFNAQNTQKFVEIEEMKGKVQLMISRQDLQKQLMKMDSAFKVVINSMKSTLMSEITSEMGESQNKMKKKFVEIMATQINEKLESYKNLQNKNLELNIDKIVKDALKKTEVLSVLPCSISKQRCEEPLKYYLKESLSCAKEGHLQTIEQKQYVYYVDLEGYLLDNECFYILDKHDRRIKLGLEQLQSLKKEGLMLGVSKL